jgi:hypothetical protein
MKNAHGILFKNKRFLRIRTSELFFDLVLILYSEFFLYSVVSRGKMLYQLFSLKWLVFAGPILAFFITWYTGLLAARYGHRIKNTKLAHIPFALFIWIPVSMFLFIDRNLVGISGGTMAKGHHYWNYFGVIVGIIAGNIFGYTERYTEEGKSVLQYRVEGMAVPSALFFFYLGFYQAFKTGNSPSIFFIISLGSYFGLFKLGSYLDDDREHKRSSFYHLFRIYVFPFIIIVILCFWEEVFIWGKINGALMNGETVSVPGMLVYLVISGIIPVRVIMAFQPPETLLGFLTGLVSISYFIFSIINLIGQVFVS